MDDEKEKGLKVRGIIEREQEVEERKKNRTREKDEKNEIKKRNST